MGRFFDADVPRAHAGALINPVARNVLHEIHSMRGMLGGHANAIDFINLERSTLTSLARIERLIVNGEIEPLARIRHSMEGRYVPRVSRELRIGVFPTAANPFHWAHLVGALIAMERFLLDKVIFVIAGRDPRKPELAAEEARHTMARAVINLFYPLFEYCSFALGTATSGEENLFKILRMNPGRRIHAFYIAGGDHYHRFNPATGNPDTISKLEAGMTSSLYEFDDRSHRVSAVFLHRGTDEEDIPTFLDVRRIERLPVQTSSTEIRRALGDRRQLARLCTLPFVALVSICGSRLYNARACKELLDSGCAPN